MKCFIKFAIKTVFYLFKKRLYFRFKLHRVPSHMHGYSTAFAYSICIHVSTSLPNCLHFDRNLCTCLNGGFCGETNNCSPEAEEKEA